MIIFEETRYIIPQFFSAQGYTCWWSFYPNRHAGSSDPGGWSRYPGSCDHELESGAGKRFLGKSGGSWSCWHKLLGNLHPTSFFRRGWEGQHFCLFVAGGDWRYPDRRYYSFEAEMDQPIASSCGLVQPFASFSSLKMVATSARSAAEAAWRGGSQS